MEMWNKDKNENDIRVIKTARDLESINAAAKRGLKPLVKRVKPSKKIRAKYAVYQNKETGEIEVAGDYRSEGGYKNNMETVINWTFYYPHCFPAPFAAYLIPNDIEIGEIVFVEDLIEDYVGASWNQGDKFRLESCQAIWNGKDLEILFNPKKDGSHFVG